MSQPIRVLLIEDNPGDAELTIETLKAGKLFVDVEVAVDGDLALKRLAGAGSRRSIPDLILLDLNLPKMDGREVLAEIKRHEDLRRIPVVILTSSDAERDVNKSYELGANCYVTKPVGLEAFRAIVRSVESFWFTVVKLP
jgi:CheY-like chemotaxis protein